MPFSPRFSFPQQVGKGGGSRLVVRRAAAAGSPPRPPLSPGRPAGSLLWRGEVGLWPSPLCLLLGFS